jgi:hypothetical protein
VVAERYLPSLVLAGGEGDATAGIALLEGRASHAPMAYVCRGYACEAPTSDVRVLGAQLDAVLRAGAQLVE